MVLSKNLNQYFMWGPILLLLELSYSILGKLEFSGQYLCSLNYEENTIFSDKTLCVERAPPSAKLVH